MLDLSYLLAPRERHNRDEVPRDADQHEHDAADAREPQQGLRVVLEQLHGSQLLIRGVFLQPARVADDDPGRAPRDRRE